MKIAFTMLAISSLVGSTCLGFGGSGNFFHDNAPKAGGGAGGAGGAGNKTIEIKN